MTDIDKYTQKIDEIMERKKKELLELFSNKKNKKMKDEDVNKLCYNISSTISRITNPLNKKKK